MKRDMTLARKILLAIEESVDDEPASIQLPTHEYDDLHISYHVRLLSEGGLIHAVKTRDFNAVTAWMPHSLTWRGHDLIDAIRDDEIWAQVAAHEKRLGGDLTTDVLYEIALREIRRKVGLPEEPAVPRLAARSAFVSGESACAAEQGQAARKSSDRAQEGRGMFASGK